MITLGSGTIQYTLTPPVLTLADGGTGSLAVGTYTYGATVETAAGESTVGITTNIALAASHKCSLTFTWPIGATALNIYRKKDGGNWNKMTRITTANTITYDDNTTSGTVVDPPATNSAWMGLGEIDGDCELDVAFEAKTFSGQSAFIKAKAYYAGKAVIKAKKCEFVAEHLRQLFGTGYSYSAPAGIYSIGQTTRPLSSAMLKFTHTRSDDPTKSIVITAYKVTSDAFVLPFPKEDFIASDIEFELLADSNNKVVDIAVTA